MTDSMRDLRSRDDSNDDADGLQAWSAGQPHEASDASAVGKSPRPSTSSADLVSRKLGRP